MKPKNRIYCAAMALLTSLFATSGAQAEEWILNNNGSWNDTANWSPASFPNAVGAVADFSTINISNHRDVNFNIPITIGSILFGDTDNNRQYRFKAGAAGTLTFDNGGISTITKNTGIGESITIPVTLNDTVEVTNNTSYSIDFNSTIDGVSGFTVNAGRLQLRSSTPTYSGPTILNNGGEVMFKNGNAIANPNTNILINEGILNKYYDGQILQSLGVAAGQLQILGGESGFSGNRNLDVIIGGNASTEVVWGSPYFKPTTLVLMGPWANPYGSTEFKNPLDLDGAPRTVAVNRDPEGQNGYGAINGLIRNSDVGNASGLTKTGPGNLLLTNNGNSYDGPTVVTDGVLMLGTAWNNSGGIPGGLSSTTSGLSNLEINGGNVRLAYYLKRPLGAGPTDFQITGGTSGFSHIQPDTWGRLSINNSTSYEVVWGDPFFKPDVFVLNEENASPTQVVQFQNKLDLNGADRTVATNAIKAITPGSANGFMTTAGGRITGVIQNTGATAGLIKTGPGHLQLTAANTYDGGTTINEGNLEFTKIAAMPATGAVTVNDGATLTVAVGGAGQWTTGTSGNGTLGGLLAGLGGQAPSTVTFVGTTGLGLNVTGSQSYAGVISGAGNLLVVGSGSLDLTGDNTFSGDIVVDGGATLFLTGDNSGATGSIRIINGFLQVDAANLPTGGVTYDSPGNNPAILANSGAFAPTIGSSDDIYWNNNGGFAATDSAFTVTANGGAIIDWSASTGFRGKKLMLGSSSSTATVELTNDIELDSNRTIRLFNNTGSSDDISILSGDIVESGSKHLYIEGAGTLSLTGNNAFGTGNRRLQISGPTVRALDGVGLPSTAVLFFANGVFESSGAFTRDISNASGNVYWNNRGGFSAHGGALNVNLQSGATLPWNATNGGFRSQDLYFGSETSDDIVTLQNDINLFGNRTVYVFDNPNTTADYTVFSGILANGSGTRELNKRGTGKLLLNGVNSYTGQTRVHQGSLGGSGTLAGKLRMEAGSNLAPGASVGTLTVLGNLEIDPLAGGSGVLEYELDSIVVSDKIAVGGIAIIGTAKLGLSDFVFTDVGGLQNGTYTLISGGAPVDGTLAGDTNGTLGLATIDLQLSGNDVELVVSGLAAGSPYDTWASLSGLTLGVNDGPNDDPEGDGVDNTLEWILGGDPLAQDSATMLPAAVGDIGTGLTLTFTREEDAISEATLLVQWNTDLSSTWNDVTIGASTSGPDGNGVVVTITDASDPDDVSVNIPASNAPNGKIFARLKATQP